MRLLTSGSSAKRDLIETFIPVSWLLLLDSGSFPDLEEATLGINHHIVYYNDGTTTVSRLIPRFRLASNQFKPHLQTTSQL